MFETKRTEKELINEVDRALAAFCDVCADLNLDNRKINGYLDGAEKAAHRLKKQYIEGGRARNLLWDECDNLAELARLSLVFQKGKLKDRYARERMRGGYVLLKQLSYSFKWDWTRSKKAYSEAFYGQLNKQCDEEKGQ